MEIQKLKETSRIKTKDENKILRDRHEWMGMKTKESNSKGTWMSNIRWTYLTHSRGSIFRNTTYNPRLKIIARMWCPIPLKATPRWIANWTHRHSFHTNLRPTRPWTAHLDSTLSKKCPTKRKPTVPIVSTLPRSTDARLNINTPTKTPTPLKLSTLNINSTTQPHSTKSIGMETSTPIPRTKTKTLLTLTNQTLVIWTHSKIIYLKKKAMKF